MHAFLDSASKLKVNKLTLVCKQTAVNKAKIGTRRLQVIFCALQGLSLALGLAVAKPKCARDFAR
jgi:hypothetical protein